MLLLDIVLAVVSLAALGGAYQLLIKQYGPGADADDEAPLPKPAIGAAAGAALAALLSFNPYVIMVVLVAATLAGRNLYATHEIGLGQTASMVCSGLAVVFVLGHAVVVLSSGPAEAPNPLVEQAQTFREARDRVLAQHIERELSGPVFLVHGKGEAEKADLLAELLPRAERVALPEESTLAAFQTTLTDAMHGGVVVLLAEIYAEDAEEPRLPPLENGHYVCVTAPAWKLSPSDFGDRRISALVLGKPNTSTKRFEDLPDPADEPRRAFDLRYVLVTPDNVEQYAERL